MRVFVAGGTGLIGVRLVSQLLDRGDQVVVLTRREAKARDKFGDRVEIAVGDPMEATAWMEKVDGCNAVVNLVGEGIFARRWNPAFKQLLRDSRIRSTRHVVEAIQRAGSKPACLVQGSAVGYYGFHEDEILTEDSPPGDDFLARLCVEWEATARPVEDAGVRLVLVRTGIVLDCGGGALAQMLMPFRLYLFGGKVGSGRQWVSWIHHADEVGLLLFAVDDERVGGPFNATAPEPVTNAVLAKAIGRAMRRPSFFPTPAFALRLTLGEVAELVTRGQRVLPKKALDLGYRFRFPDIDSALQDLLAG